MSNLNNRIFESHSLPSGYTVKRAEEEDILGILKYEWFDNTALKLVWAFMFPVHILIFLPGGYSAWKKLHRSIVFETGIEPLSNPDFAGWLYILFTASKFALLLFATNMFFIFVMFYCFYVYYYQSLADSNECNYIPNHWIVKHRNKIVGEVKLRENNAYLKLNSLSIHPRHRNRGIGSYLLWTAIKDIDKPVYLLCASGMQSFYRRFGFVSVSHRETPVALKPAFGYKVMKSF